MAKRTRRSKPFELLSYTKVLQRLPSGRSNLLLGNGFSISCDPVFSYPSLYQAALEAGLSKRAQKVFAHVGENNFEGVLRILDEAHWVARTYRLVEKDASEMLSDAEVIKKALVRAIAGSHLEHSGCVTDDKKANAAALLDPYHNVFTTNYDLLLYWVTLHGGQPRWRDGFAEDEDDRDAEYVIFSHRIGGERGLYFLHGALHLYAEGGQLRKHCWNRSQKPLMDLVREGLAKAKYPLFVAEGDPAKKLDQILNTPYLWYCHQKLCGIKTPLVVFGHALGPSDAHIAEAIVDNLSLEDLYVGLHGDPESETNRATRTAAEQMVAARNHRRASFGRGKEIKLSFYDSGTAKAWG